MLSLLLAVTTIPLCLAAVLKGDANVGFFDPTANGGSWLDSAAPPLGEPMNVGAHGPTRELQYLT